VPYDSQKHHRRSIRIQGIDYAQPGAYFITVVTHHRICFLSEIIAGAVILKTAGTACMAVWKELPRHFSNLALGDIVVMPNHLQEKAPRALPEIVGEFKSYSTRRINALRSTSGASVWQRGYYEHIVRDDADFSRIRAYILSNPTQWDFDEEKPSRV
jgi:putative transposase